MNKKDNHMKTQIVEVPTIKVPIAPSPGFLKKELSDFKLDIMALCEFGCKYCSSNNGNYLRIRRSKFADLTEQQLGERVLPKDNPKLSFHWPDILQNLSNQLARKSDNFGQGKTLVFSMLTDGFSPELIKNETTINALRMVLEQTQFRIRVLTKNSIVGTKKWIDFFKKYRDRFVIGLSIGTLDNMWAKKVEIGTSPPQQRLKALRQLQDAGVSTYGMLCPVFPDMLEADRLETLIDQIQPNVVEHIWAEPFNDRDNWKQVREGYRSGSTGYKWLTAVYEEKQNGIWSKYATDLYLQLCKKAEDEGWIDKLRYLLYEHDISETDARKISGLKGVLLQSKMDGEGKSKNPSFALLQ